MKKEYIFLMFALCFGVWATVVDTLIIPASKTLDVHVGLFSRYRVKEWKGDGKIDLLKDKLLIYANVRGREQFYYIDRTVYFEAALRNLPAGSPIELRYSKGFPKFWQRSLQEIHSNGSPIVRYSSSYLAEKQAFIYKFTAVIVGAFFLLCGLGFINKPRRRKK